MRLLSDDQEDGDDYDVWDWIELLFGGL